MPQNQGALFPISDLASARAALSGLSVWTISDGKAGDEAQLLGLTERLDLTPMRKIIAPRAPFSWFMPYGPIDPRDAPTRPASPIAPPFPDIAIATGRRAVPYLRAIKRASMGRTFAVFLKDPRIGTRAADFIWVPEHDDLRGQNVLTTLTSPHRITQEELAALRAAPPAPIAQLKTPRLALLIGGNSRRMLFSAADIADLIAALRALPVETGLMATASRRTPPELSAPIRAEILARGGFFWDETGENPYKAMLASADAILVTADSMNMIGEALATGKPVMVFRSGASGHRSRKIDHFLNELERFHRIHPLTASLPTGTNDPIDATPIIAMELARRYQTFLTQQKR
jgi:uncharacterized protein